MPFGKPVPTSSVGAVGAKFNNDIDALLFGLKWRDYTVTAPITYSFTNSINDYEPTYPNLSSHKASFKTLNAAQRIAARGWMTQYANISNANFQELTGASVRDATIRMASSNVPSTASAEYPNSSIVEGGDAWFNESTGSYSNPILGTYAYHTFGHELGHALGLKHGHASGGVRNVALNLGLDSMEFSIMTYRSYIGGPITGYRNESGGYAQTLMMYDIAAIQQMYGADFTTNETNTTYTFSTTTGEMFSNGVGQGVPYSNRIFRTIWDGDGVDTYNFSNYPTSLSIDLTPGGWVDLDRLDNFQRANLGGGTGGGLHSGHARAHIFNALQFGGDSRSLIENAIGGTGNDVLIGNAANNTLDGGAGADSMAGGLGNDTYIVDNISDVVTEVANNGTDTVQSSVTHTLAANVENLTLTGILAINGTGNIDNNSITGNSANNTLNGGGGSRPSADSLTGLGGSDIFVFQFGQSVVTAFDRITDFTINTDKIDLLTHYGLAMAPPVAFSRAADNTSRSLNTLIFNVFSDCNGALVGNQALGLNSAALVVATALPSPGTYLIINDGTMISFDGSDLLINITGYSGSLPGLGSITPSTWFV